jgi:hypothetical protein
MATDVKDRDAAQQTVWAPSLTATEVHVGTPGPTGGLWVAPAGTALPTDCKTAFASPWLPLGYVSDAGPTVGQATAKQDLIPWQSMAPVRSVITTRDVTLHFILWQLNAQSLSLYFDADPPTPSPTDGSFTMPVQADKGGHQYAFAVSTVDGLNVLRIGMTRAQLTDAGDMAITRATVVPMECTLTALVDNNVLCTVMSGLSQ